MRGGEFSSTLFHLRPSWWPFIWAHFLTGFVVAHTGNALTLDAEQWLRALVAGGLWAVCLGGAATGLTYLFQSFPQSGRYGRPAGHGNLPRSLGWTSVGLLLVGLAASPVMGWRHFETYLVGIVMIVVCVAPPVRLGRSLLGSLVVQACGHGVLTFYAGYALVGTAALPTPVLRPYLLGFACLILALRMIVWTATFRFLPVLYAICLLNAFGCLALAEALSGGKWRAATLGVAFLAWCLAALGRRRDGQQMRLILALTAWFLTDGALAFLALVR